MLKKSCFLQTMYYSSLLLMKYSLNKRCRAFKYAFSLRSQKPVKLVWLYFGKALSHLRPVLGQGREKVCKKYL